MFRTAIVCSAFALATILLTGCPPTPPALVDAGAPPPPPPPPPPPAPMADFGDAAEPGFPSLKASQGPRHITVNEEWIGSNNDGDTTVEADALEPDRDNEGQGPSIGVTIVALSIPAPTVAAVAVTAKPPFDAPRFLNVLHDVNASGTWGDGVHNEWIARNIAVDLSRATTLPNGNRRVWVQVPPFFFADGAVLGPRMMRATLTREKLDASQPWKGKGPAAGFTHGETEDDLADLNNPSPKNCVLRWTAVQGAPTNVVKMTRQRGNWSLRVTQIAGNCPDPLVGAPPGTLFEVELQPSNQCITLAGNPQNFNHGMAPNPWQGGPPPNAPPPRVWNSPGYTATWDCPNDPRCTKQCNVTFRYDPAAELVIEPSYAIFDVEGEKGKPARMCDPKERGELCTPDGRLSICGDKQVDIYEKCDDGNLKDGDGCSSLCFPEQKGKPEIPAKKSDAPPAPPTPAPPTPAPTPPL